jgi:acetyl-CoA acetyltransferase
VADTYLVFGIFRWDRVNPHGGSLAVGYPFAATAALLEHIQ